MGRCRRAYLYRTDDGSNGISALLRASAVSTTRVLAENNNLFQPRTIIILAENINRFTQEKQSFYLKTTIVLPEQYRHFIINQHQQKHTQSDETEILHTDCSYRNGNDHTRRTDRPENRNLHGIHLERRKTLGEPHSTLRTTDPQ